MATKDFNELENKAYGSTNSNNSTFKNDETTQGKTSVKSQENYSIVNDRNALAQEGYIDGLWASQDYVDGLRKGLNDGIVQGRQRLFKEFSRDLKTIRQAPITIDLASICDNFPIIETRVNFALPEGN